MANTLKVGMIGTGGIARTHMPGWAASEHAEVIAAADLNEAALNEFGTQYDVTQLMTDSAELIRNPDIDIIDICTPNNYHAPLAIAALEAGKHVICEKPLAPTPAAVQSMIDARNASGKMLMTAQNYRFKGTSKALKAEIDAGTLGEIYHARSWHLRRAFTPVTSSFVTKKHAAGGACIDIGVHILDQTLWFMGNPKPVTVSGVSRTELAHIPGAFTTWRDRPVDPSIYDVEEFASAFVRFENGATLMLEVSWLLHHNVQSGGIEDMQLWLYGKDGGAEWPKCEVYQTNYQTRQHYNRKLLRTADKLESHAQECVEFAQAIADSAPSPVSAEQSLQVMTILDAIYKSQETGREVVL